MDHADAIRPAARYLLVVLLLAYILSFIDRQILNLLIAPIRQDLRLSDFEMSLLQGLAFALFYGVLGLPIGRLADRGSRRKLIAVGILLWSVMTGLCGLAGSFATLFIARMGVGVGEATLSPAAYSALSDAFPPARLTRAISIYTAGITVGGGLAYIAGGSVISWVASRPPISLPWGPELRSWQLVFFIVAAPGLLISALMCTVTEPLRRGLLRNRGTDAPACVSITQVLRMMGQRFPVYAPIIGGVALLSVLGYGYLNWYPAFLARTFGLSVRTIGIEFGTIYLVFGTAGTLIGASLSERLSRNGYRDANPRVVMLVAAALAIPATVGPLLPSAPLVLIAAAPTVLLLNAFFGAAIAALQLVTPNQMRAVVSAVLLLVSTLIGLGFGSSIVAALTDFVFHDDSSLRYSLAIVAAATCPLAAMITWTGLRAYRNAIDEATSWS